MTTDYIYLIVLYKNKPTSCNIRQSKNPWRIFGGFFYVMAVGMFCFYTTHWYYPVLFFLFLFPILVSTLEHVKSFKWDKSFFSYVLVSLIVLKIQVPGFKQFIWHKLNQATDIGRIEKENQIIAWFPSQEKKNQRLVWGYFSISIWVVSIDLFWFYFMSFSYNGVYFLWLISLGVLRATFWL